MVDNSQQAELGLSTIHDSIDVDDARHNASHSDEKEEKKIMEIQKQQEIESIMLVFID